MKKTSPFSVVVLVIVCMAILLPVYSFASTGCPMPQAWYMHRLKVAPSDTSVLSERFERLRECSPDMHTLAERLLGEEDGTIVSLGMDLVVLEGLDDGDLLLKERLSDKRWNWGLQCNDNYARALLGVWKLKKGMPLSAQERHEMLCNESSELYSRFSVERPAGAVVPDDCAPYRRAQDCHQ